MNTTRRNFLASIPFLAALFGIRKADTVAGKLKAQITFDTVKFVDGVKQAEISLGKLQVWTKEDSQKLEEIAKQLTCFGGK